jgi:hypothetical protein
VAAQKLKFENEKDSLEVTSQTKVSLTSVLPNVTCHICCYFKLGSIVLALFDYSANNNLEIHSPQCIRQYLKLDWYIKRVIDVQTNTSAFVLYVKPLIMCHNLKYSCILSKDHFYITIARLGWLSCIVTSDLQWYMNNQSLYFSMTNIYDMSVVLLKGILGLNYLAYPTSGMCKRAVRQLKQSVDHPLPPCYSISEWIHNYLECSWGKLVSSVTLLLSKCGSVLCYKLASWIKHGKNWDPGSDGYYFHAEGSLQSKQWDPGGLSFGTVCFALNLEATWKNVAIIQLYSLVHKKDMLNLKLLQELLLSVNNFILTSTLRTRLVLKGMVL